MFNGPMQLNKFSCISVQWGCFSLHNHSNLCAFPVLLTFCADEDQDFTIHIFIRSYRPIERKKRIPKLAMLTLRVHYER